ncbi:MAG: cell division protein FtsQ [Tannerellaceae bacterium]|jgi:cell division protein FtsQ|nr:cell division protein FtsQ [Tannerellaceae bacterium]
MKRLRTIRLFAAVLTLLLMIYIIIVAVRFKDTKQDDQCRGLSVTIKSENGKTFLTESEIVLALKNAGLHPNGKPMNEINTNKIKLEIRRNGLVSDVDVYKTPSDMIKIKVMEKTPVLRIITGSSDYYVDRKGEIMPASGKYAAYTPVASGNIEKDYARTNLYEFSLFLLENEFWNNQIEQIYIRPDKEVELIPRVGDHRILLGSFDNFKEKLSNLRLFYEQAIPKIGWNKYGIINLKYKNQIVCTKK